MSASTKNEEEEDVDGDEEDEEGDENEDSASLPSRRSGKRACAGMAGWRVAVLGVELGTEVATDFGLGIILIL